MASIAKGWKEVKAAAEQRGAGSDYIEAIERNTECIGELQKARMHGHGLQQLDANVAVLRADNRYAAHTGAELAKVACYRGLVEKSGEFSGQVPNIKGFDAAMADRAKVDQLPSVER